jgi:hypothetical protein
MRKRPTCSKRRHFARGMGRCRAHSGIAMVVYCHRQPQRLTGLSMSFTALKWPSLGCAGMPSKWVISG